MKQQIDNIFKVVWIANNILNQNKMQRAAMVNLIHCNIHGVTASNQKQLWCVCIDASILGGNSHVISIVLQSRNNRISEKVLASHFIFYLGCMHHGQIPPGQTRRVTRWFISMTKEVIHQIIHHNTCLFGRNAATTMEFGDACLKETISVTREIHNINDIA